MALHSSLGRLCVSRSLLLLATLAGSSTIGRAVTSPAQQASIEFGGAYSTLDPRRQKLVNDWVARFSEVTGQEVDAGPFYDTFVKLSSKTTFEAITHALMTTSLTDASGERMGDTLDLVERMESVRGQVSGASGDRQFRMYALLTESALRTLARAQEFKRSADNTVFHKGYPISYREQSGAPSIQISIATDGRRRHRRGLPGR